MGEFKNLIEIVTKEYPTSGIDEGAGSVSALGVSILEDISLHGVSFLGSWTQCSV